MAKVNRFLIKDKTAEELSESRILRRRIFLGTLAWMLFGASLDTCCSTPQLFR
jgi:hypothetical protein